MGKASGKILTVFPEVASLNNSTPKIISRVIAKSIKAPAKAKASTSPPNNLRMLSPKRRIKIMITNKTSVADPEWIWPDYPLNLIIIGIEPIMSITANKTIVALNISAQSNP